MWVRSQDLFTLVKCERLSVRQCASDFFDVIGNGIITLGRYSTLDEALEVLEDMESNLECPYNTVFQMPQYDEAVE